MNISRRRFLGTLLASVATAALLPKPSHRVVVHLSDRYGWYFIDDGKPRILEWCDHGDEDAWTTEDIRYRTVLMPAQFAMSTVPSAPFPKWVWQ